MPEPQLLRRKLPVEGVLLLELYRPEQRNALSTPLLKQVAEALNDAAESPEVRVAVITGGSRVFAAGADIEELKRTTGDDPVRSQRFEAWEQIRSFPKPFIAAIEGWCLGAGAELVLCTDIAIAGRDVRIGFPETSLGIIPGAGGTAILPRVVGRREAMKLVLTGQPIDAQYARQIGLINEVVEAGGALEAAMLSAKALVARAPLAIMMAKASIRDADSLDEPTHLERERRRFVELLGTDDKTEGIAAFHQKRPPAWEGR